jgi:superfamily I DNA/RNA helicase
MNLNNVEWSKKQKQILEDKNSFVVSGCVGSGKTILAISKAIKIEKEHLGSYIVILFTKSLKSFFIQNLSLNKKQINRIFHLNEWEKKGCPEADYFIIDEAQDFSENEIRKFLNKAKKGIYFFGDDDQSLYSTNFNNEKTIKISKINKIAKIKLYTLNKNYRSSNEISKYIKKLFHKKYLTNISKIGIKPKFINFNSPNEELDWIVSYIKKNTNKSIAILLCRNDEYKIKYGRDKSRMKEIEFPGIIDLVKHLKQHNISCGYKHYNYEKLLFKTPCSINILTYHSAKGLQFDVVIMPFLNICYGYFPDSSGIPIFVALSRASHELYILYSDIINYQFDSVLNKDYYSGEIITSLHYSTSKFIKSIIEERENS